MAQSKSSIFPYEKWWIFPSFFGTGQVQRSFPRSQRRFLAFLTLFARFSFAYWWLGGLTTIHGFPGDDLGKLKENKAEKIVVAKNRLVFGCTIFRHHLAVCRKSWQSDFPFHVKTFRLLGTSQMTQMIPLKCPWLGAISSPSLMTQKGASMCRYTWSSGSRYRR